MQLASFHLELLNREESLIEGLNLFFLFIQLDLRLPKLASQALVVGAQLIGVTLLVF